MKHANGFSLVELMVVVAIVGILSSIAVPAYSEYVQRGQLVEGVNALATGRIQMEQFFQDNRRYDLAGSPCPANTAHFTYVCNNLTQTTYRITATGAGSIAGFSYNINQANVKTSATPWGNGATCWIMRRGDAC
ncbi:MAG: prepilin-type N-terminal cleavage/methylation domain-containing protein [Gallionella sp.]|nr:prepilin-type N-terminal cleavage/methylation domain-containing protein [Gallionella sp.]